MKNRKFIDPIIQKLKSEKIILIINHHLEDLKDIADEILVINETKINEVVIASA